MLQLIIFILLLSGCSTTSQDNEEPLLKEIKPDDLITMELLDDYMNRPDVQYIDLRNMDAKFRSGYIKDFESIPFFDYLDNRLFVRYGTYEFNPDQIQNEELIRAMFDEDKAIFLYAAGCVRSAYVREVLLYLGYERVYVLGGYYEYEGEHKVLGDGSFDLGNSEYRIHVASDGTTYRLGVTYEITKAIMDIRIDIISPEGISYRSENFSSEINYNEQLTILENYIESQYTNLYTIHEFLSNETPDHYDTIEDYTLGFSDDLVSLFGN